MFATIHRIFYGIAWLMAVIGGLVLTILVLMLCLSIIGREASDLLHSTWMQSTMPGLARQLLDAGVGPIFGDYELLVGGLAFAVFCFLGWCQITAGHATVDVFTSGLSDRTRRWMQVLIEALFAAALVLIAVQLYDGMNTLARRRSTTFLLQYPLWWNYALALVPAIATAAIAVYMALVRLAEAVTNRTLIATAGADH
ncbi:TRAP transporter small permease [Pararhodobacter aggregans]|uniref:TRAP transporter small permease protein n=1 Tax=Pararhodobacter aggregans TaxID=404875 RepID=A0A2T7UTT9_9RHOB|nr:TRAP transporter small permease subunit [Pararhodobacter aggregans]PTX02762.1 tripartite ATP-independent transporter DctQ subunit [Pararhodobacter aggregans]PVE47991.1 C4-dicarboxylate ABC transporter permease [Pararhodobacter aggregans]